MSTRARSARGAAVSLVLGLLLVALMTGDARGSSRWSWPVKGAVLTKYSNDDANPYAAGMHRGIDVAAPAGTVVRAARAGEVTYAGPLGYSGLTVAVRTPDRYVTSYLHLSAVAVRRGESVAGGTRLGAVGTTGRRSTPAPHLHFGVRIAGTEHRYVDPLALLPVPGGARRMAPALRAPAVAPVAVHPAPARVPARSPTPRLQPSLPDPGLPLSLAGVALLLLTMLGAVARGRRRPAALPGVAAAPTRPGSPRPRSRPESAGLAAH